MQTADFYNQQVQQHSTIDAATQNVRAFHRWVIDSLFREAVPPGAVALDICCGKGGDLNRWKKSLVKAVYFCDIAKTALDEAEKRFRSGRFPFDAKFACFDCFSEPLASHFDPSLRFDVVSCQMALHYAFASRSSLQQFLKNVASQLKSGGKFIATFADGAEIVRQFHAAGKPAFGNSIFSVTSSLPLHDRSTRIPEFGAKYHFYLAGDKSVNVNASEFLAHINVLKSHAAEVGLRCLRHFPFRDCVQKYGHCVPAEQLAMSAVYSGVIFQKQ